MDTSRSLHTELGGFHGQKLELNSLTYTFNWQDNSNHASERESDEFIAETSSVPVRW